MLFWMSQCRAVLMEVTEEPEATTMALVDGTKCAELEQVLGREGSTIEFEDMRQLGSNPARIIQAWHDFVDAHAGRAVRGVGEPVTPAREGDELDECRLPVPSRARG